MCESLSLTVSRNPILSENTDKKKPQKKIRFLFLSFNRSLKSFHYYKSWPHREKKINICRDDLFCNVSGIYFKISYCYCGLAKDIMWLYSILLIESFHHLNGNKVKKKNFKLRKYKQWRTFCILTLLLHLSYNLYLYACVCLLPAETLKQWRI